MYTHISTHDINCTYIIWHVCGIPGRSGLRGCRAGLSLVEAGREAPRQYEGSGGHGGFPGEIQGKIGETIRKPWEFRGKVGGTLEHSCFFAGLLGVEKGGTLKMSGENLVFFERCLREHGDFIGEL